MLPVESAHNRAIGPGCIGSSFNVPQRDTVNPPREKRVQEPLSGAKPFLTDPSDLAGDPRTRTQYPYVTGASIVAMKYKDGVLIACDTLASYGSTKRYKSVQRLFKVNDKCIVGASGELSDFQELQTYLDELAEEDYMCDDGIQYTPKEVHAYLCRVMYNKRSDFDPFWNSLVVAGMQDGAPFVGFVSMIGVSYSDNYVTTGFASHLGLPLLREHYRPDITEEEASELLQKALKVCYYRDKSSINKFTMGKVGAAGVTISEPFSLRTDWQFKVMQNPSQFSVGAW